MDAEFDHFEAVRPELRSAVPQLVARAASDGMAAMADTAAAENPAASRQVAIVGATILDMTGRKPIPNGTVVVADGRIAEVGPSSRVVIPPQATVVRAAGKTVMPGLWDMHAHFEQVEWGPIYLAAGVTTVRDVGNELEFIAAVRDAVASGQGLGPRMLLAGLIDGPGSRGLGVTRAATPEEGRAWVNRYHDAGFDQIKIYSSIALDVLRAITAEAHKLGMTVTGHVPDSMNAFTAIDAGLDQIDHAEYVGVAASQDPQEVIAELKRHRTVIDPTLALYELLARPLNQPIDAFEPGIRKVARELEAPLNGFGSPVDTAAAPARAAERQPGAGRAPASRRHSHRRRHRPVGARTQPAPGDRALRAGRDVAVRRAVGGDGRTRARDEEDRRQRDHRKGQTRRSDRPRRQPARRRPHDAPHLPRRHQRARVRSGVALAERRLPAVTLRA